MLAWMLAVMVQTMCTLLMLHAHMKLLASVLVSVSCSFDGCPVI